MIHSWKKIGEHFGIVDRQICENNFQVREKILQWFQGRSDRPLLTVGDFLKNKRNPVCLSMTTRKIVYCPLKVSSAFGVNNDFPDFGK